MNTQELRKLKSLDELYAEIDQLQADAARYQWLRKNGFALTGDLCKKLVPVCLFEDADSAVDRQMAIDAAMKGNP